MKFSLVIEAIDKASKAVKSIANTNKAANAANVKGAEKAARASDKAAKALGKEGQAANKAAKAIHNTAKATDKANTASTRAQRLLGTRVKGWRAEANALERLNKVYARWTNLQARRVALGGLRIGRGVGNIGQGARGVAKYGMMMGGAAAGVGLGAGAITKNLLGKATEWQGLQGELEAISKSADEAGKSLEWIAKQQLPPHGLADLTKGFIVLRDAGVDPTKGALKAVADMATGTGASVESAARAYQDALIGRTMGLKQFGIEAQKSGQYMEYIFAGKDGRRKRIRAPENDRGANAAAIMAVMQRRFGGATDDLAKTWDGMIWRLKQAFANFQRSVVNSGLFDFVESRLTMLLAQIDKWSDDGTLDRWAKDISDGLIKVLTVGWDVAQGLWAAGKMIFGVLDTLSVYVGGWENMVMILIALPVAGSLWRMAVGFIQVATGIATFLSFGSTAIGLFARLEGISKLGAVLRLLLTPIGLVTRSFITMGIAFMTTPIGWVVAGIMLIAGGAYLIYRNWDKIGPWFKAKWAETKQIFWDFWSWVKSLFTWDNVLTVINWASYLLPVRWLEFIPGFPGWSVVLNPLEWGQFLPDIDWAAIINSPFVQMLCDKVTGVFRWMVDKISGVFQKVKGAWNWVKGLFSGDDDAAAVNIVAQDPAAIAAAAAEVDKLTAKLEALAGVEFSGTNAELAALQTKTAETIAKAGGVAKAFEASVKTARSILDRTSFESHGVALMRTFAQGIRKGAGAAVAATRDVVGQIRDYLPHSPAKVGPLSDLDKVRFSETLATAMRPAPAVKAAEHVAAGVRNVLSAPLSARASSPLSAGLPSGGAAGPVTVSFAPVINVSGSGNKGDIEAAIKEAYSRFKADLPRLMDEVARRKARIAY